jgi:hypothetical protein
MNPLVSPLACAAVGLRLPAVGTFFEGTKWIATWLLAEASTSMRDRHMDRQHGPSGD